MSTLNLYSVGGNTLAGIADVIDSMQFGSLSIPPNIEFGLLELLRMSINPISVGVIKPNHMPNDMGTVSETPGLRDAMRIVKGHMTKERDALDCMEDLTANGLKRFTKLK